MSEEATRYTVKAEADSGRAVLVRIVGLGVKTWLPRSRVVLPEDVHAGDQFEVDIPNWIIRNEIGEPDH